MDNYCFIKVYNLLGIVFFILLRKGFLEIILGGSNFLCSLSHSVQMAMFRKMILALSKMYWVANCQLGTTISIRGW